MFTNPDRNYKGKHRKKTNKLSALDWMALALGFILTIMFSSFTGAVL